MSEINAAMTVFRSLIQTSNSNAVRYYAMAALYFTSLLSRFIWQDARSNAEAVIARGAKKRIKPTKVVR